MSKIALVMQSLEGGGVQKVMVGLANGLLKIGENIIIDMIVGDAQGAMRSELSDKVRVVDFGKQRYHGDFKMLASIPRLVSYMRQNRDSIILAAPGFASVAAVIAKLFTRSKIILIVDDKLSLLKTRGIKGWISFTLYYITFRFADAIVAAHDNAAKDIAKSLYINANKIHRIYHPLIDPEIIRHTKPISKELDNFIEKDDVLLIAAGRLTWVKDYQNLIKAFSVVPSKHDNVKLIILGEGPDADKLMQLIDEKGLDSRVLLYGYSDNPLAFMKRADICISSSRQEAFGITLVEALACGTTVVATDCSSGGPREILGDGKYGYLCPIEDTEALTKAIEKALLKPIGAEKARKRGMQFSIESSVAQYKILINEVAAS